MKIGVISDTHIFMGSGWKKLASRVLSGCSPDLEKIDKLAAKHFSDVDLILHAGDITTPPVLDLLATYAPVEAVQGNMDNAQIKDTLPIKKVLEVKDGVKIGLIHGWGAGLAEMVAKEFNMDEVNAIVFGHSHSPLCETRDGVLFFNPGSPTDRRFAKYNSLGILTLKDKIIEGEIIKLN